MEAVRDIQRELSGGQLACAAGAPQREFWSVVLLEMENGAVGIGWDGVGSLGHEGRRLSHHLKAEWRRSWQGGGGGAPRRWEAGKERFWN